MRRLMTAIAALGFLACNSPVNESSKPHLGLIEFGREYTYRQIEQLGQEVDTSVNLLHLKITATELPNGNDSLVVRDSTSYSEDTCYYEQSDSILRLTKYLPGNLSRILSKRRSLADDQLPAILLYNLVQDQPVTTSHSINGQAYLTTMTYLGLRSISVPAGDFLCHVVKSTDDFDLERFYYFDKNGIVKKEDYSKLDTVVFDSLGNVTADSLVEFNHFYELVSSKK